MYIRATVPPMAHYEAAVSCADSLRIPGISSTQPG
jgi:hypothetical protein